MMALLKVHVDQVGIMLSEYTKDNWGRVSAKSIVDGAQCSESKLGGPMVLHGRPQYYSLGRRSKRHGGITGDVQQFSD
ncbi:hypothetical protein QJS10_CPA16g00849 [Acorus calamus]|uniref:Uncharacterized protein n=1 Tax=Acorus calamus TaxID=4465 RepID=A0AAV9D4C2_ACOCL|nr:hypothetical protein QJS10_CPA16g00849 [Acorus calamus]